MIFYNQVQNIQQLSWEVKLAEEVKTVWSDH